MEKRKILVFFSRLVYVIGAGLAISIFLMFVARPVGVFVSTVHSRLHLKEETMVAWVGLRGAVPIILATFSLLAGIAKADVIFNVVFFIVLTSALLQGTTIPLIAKWLRVDAPFLLKRLILSSANRRKMKCDMAEVQIPDNSIVSSKRILEIGLPDGALIVLIKRDDEFFVPGGGTVLREGDNLLVLADKDTFRKVSSIIETQAVKPE